MINKFELELGGKQLIVETGKLAKQADGAVTVQLGGTVVLTTVVCSKNPKEGVDFLPLTVDYREKTSAAGKIPGGFFKREGRPSEKEILTARLVDRPIRPLFEKGFTYELQVMSMVLSADAENDSDILALIGASTALSISNIPFNGPIAAVRVGRIDDKFVLNPTFQELESSSMNLIVASNGEDVIMIEAGMNEVSEEIALEGVEFAGGGLKKIVELQKEMVKKCGVEKRKIELSKIEPAITEKVKEIALSKLNDLVHIPSKEQREEALASIKKELVEKLVSEETGYAEGDIKIALVKLEKEIVRKAILDSEKRIDGRTRKDIRSISCEVGILPRTHGSGLFTRGQTQSLSVTTLGTSVDEQRIDALEGETFKSFMLHYNFPPFSVGEVRPNRGPGRREIGHGALAEKSLKPVMPSKEEFPYTVRLVSDILESNGSSSMATVCASVLSLMDAGVPIKKPVAGIAIGLVKENDKHVILTDIAGLEDHFGDMDCKVAGTKDGITAMQLDLKISGITMDILKEAFSQAKEARMTVLEKLSAAIENPREYLSSYAPRIVTIKVPQEKIRDVIGSGGKVIRKIIQDTGATVDIEDDGSCQVASTDEAAMKKAVDIIKNIIEDPEVGKIYKGKVVRIMDFGAFCEILPGKDGLCHVSELSDRFVKSASDEVKVGDEFDVKLIEIDQQGRLNLSRKQAMKSGESDGFDKSRDKQRGKR
ncbi:MAG: polyribonucleotide nucleotidyltransferase [Candidatus Omnitrophota bacterium]|nr:polyribonucleotide nucleotidyltransferase [Candidatus Omnitrophota bacterium]